MSNGVERPFTGCHLLQYGSRLESLSHSIRQPFQTPGHPSSAFCIGPTKGSASERREPQTQDGPHISIAWACDDFLLQTPNSLVCHLQNHPILYLLRGEYGLSLIHISEPTRLRRISYAVFCLKKK